MTDNPLRDCPTSPNCVCTLATRPTHLMTPVKFNGTCEQAIQRICECLKNLPRTTIISRSAAHVHATCRSRVFGFIDDVEFFAEEATQLLHFRSASRLGYHDLGANRRRMEKVIAQFTSVDS